ncbi:MAG: septum formation initiator family protein [Crocinitomicaceae bacterium]|nr:septum formation initiator family protein [Crocinitomicaceae bacterium]
MKSVLNLLRNKFILVTAIFFVYTLFLDENDIFTIFSQSNKLSHLQEDTNQMKQDLEETQITLEKLKRKPEVERYAREKKFFKKDDEDICVIFYE